MEKFSVLSVDDNEDQRIRKAKIREPDAVSWKGPRPNTSGLRVKVFKLDLVGYHVMVQLLAELQSLEMRSRTVPADLSQTKHFDPKAIQISGLTDPWR